MHIFPYSPRPGTPAAKMENQVKNSVKIFRAARAAAIAEAMEEKYLQSLVGSRLKVLFETEEKGFFTGHAGNYMKVAVEGNSLHNVEKTVIITGINKDVLTGVLDE